MPKQTYEEPLQHPFTKKTSPNQLSLVCLYEVSNHPTYKLIGRVKYILTLQLESRLNLKSTKIVWLL